MVWISIPVERIIWTACFVDRAHTASFSQIFSTEKCSSRDVFLITLISFEQAPRAQMKCNGKKHMENSLSVGRVEGGEKRVMLCENLAFEKSTPFDVNFK